MITSKSHKMLSVFGLVMINVIAIGSLRNLPITASYGSHVIVLYIIAAVGFLIPCCFMTAMLATRHPETGGTYIWVEKAFGQRWAFVTIWMLWIYNVVWFPTILSFIGANIAYLINPALASQSTFIVPVIIGIFLLASWINNRGIHTASWFSSLGATLGTLLPMLLIIGLGIWWFTSDHPTAIHFNAHSLLPSVSNWHDLGFMTVIVFSLMGIEMSAIHAGDVKNPRRDFPRALLISAVMIVILSILISLAIALVIPPSQLSLVGGVDQGLSLLLNACGLHGLFPIIILLVLFGIFAGMTAWSLGPARGMMIAAQQGCAPKWFAKTNSKGAPSHMLFTQLIIVVVLALMYFVFKNINELYGTLSILTSQLALIYYLLFFAAGIKLGLRKTSGNHYQIPGGHLGLWIIGLLGLLTCSIITLLGFIPPQAVAGMGIVKYEAVLVLGIVIFVGLPLMVKRRSHSK